jgi:hypothetical protein
MAVQEVIGHSWDGAPYIGSAWNQISNAALLTGLVLSL